MTRVVFEEKFNSIDYNLIFRLIMYQKHSWSIYLKYTTFVYKNCEGISWNIYKVRTKQLVFLSFAVVLLCSLSGVTISLTFLVL